MREVADGARIRRFLRALGREADEGTAYLTGGATAVLVGWRDTTIDVDLKLVPESERTLRALPRLKDELRINVELASPADFIPVPAGWEDRSPFVTREGRLTIRHFDPYAQALAKLERTRAGSGGRDRDAPPRPGRAERAGPTLRKHRTRALPIPRRRSCLVSPTRRGSDYLTAPQHWLLVRGRGEKPLPARGFTLERHSSTRRPTVQQGDLAICYASVWQAVFAVVEIVSAPEEDPERERWRWSFRIRPLVALDDLDRAIPSEEVGVFPSSLWRHSYIRLTPEQFETARAAIEART